MLGPFCAWVAVMPDIKAWPLPSARSLLLHWLADQVKGNHFVDLRTRLRGYLGRGGKADALAVGDTVAVGGFELRPGAFLSQGR